MGGGEEVVFVCKWVCVCLYACMQARTHACLKRGGWEKGKYAAVCCMREGVSNHVNVYNGSGCSARDVMCSTLCSRLQCEVSHHVFRIMCNARDVMCLDGTAHGDSMYMTRITSSVCFTSSVMRVM